MISLSTINLYAPDTALSAGRLVEGRGLTPRTPTVDLANAPTARALPEGTIVHAPIQRVTSAQMDMRPVERADAALMAVIEPETFDTFLAALQRDGDWRSPLQGFSQRLAQNPSWLNDSYRQRAAELLRQTAYFMDLSNLS